MRARAAAVAAQAAAIVGLTLVSATASAQSSDSTGTSNGSVRNGQWLRSVSVGVPAYGGQAIVPAAIFNVQWTSARPNRLGADFGLGVVPVGLAFGTGVFGGRAGVALPIGVAPGLLIIPSGGMSALAMVGPWGGSATPGYHAGAAVVILGPTGSGIRLGATEHRFHDLDVPFQLIELGFVRRSRQ